jgi:hypothetical protein
MPKYPQIEQSPRSHGPRQNSVPKGEIMELNPRLCASRSGNTCEERQGNQKRCDSLHSVSPSVDRDWFDPQRREQGMHQKEATRCSTRNRRVMKFFAAGTLSLLVQNEAQLGRATHILIAAKSR